MHFHLGQLAEAERLVRCWHYSRKIPSTVNLVGSWHLDGGLFGTTGPMVAACLVSVPGTRWAEPVLELSRLVRVEGVAIPPLSGLVAATMRQVRRKGIGNLVVSFADVSHGHHGGIYQASSWRFSGKREPNMDGLLINGFLVAGRTVNHVYGSQSVAVLEKRGVVAERHFDEGKYLYWLPLTKQGAAKADRLGLARLPYPKPTGDANGETATAARD